MAMFIISKYLLFTNSFCLLYFFISLFSYSHPPHTRAYAVKGHETRLLFVTAQQVNNKEGGEEEKVINERLNPFS